MSECGPIGGLLDSYAAPLKFGATLQFNDRWRGKLAGFEITEDWEVVNLLAESGAFSWKRSVRLPFSAAQEWDDDHISFGCTSVEAFAREVPPLAVPARPVSEKTPIAVGGLSLTGALVRASDRRATEALLRHGFNEYRVRTEDVAFEGKTMTLSIHVENMPLYRPDSVLREDVWQALQRDPFVTADDRREMQIEAVGGHARLHGNVRTKYAKEHAERALSDIPGLMSLANELVDDLELEQNVGLAMEQAGIQRSAEIYVRSSLGDVTLTGYAPSAEMADEAVRVVSRAPGVRRVTNRIEVRPREVPAKPAPAVVAKTGVTTPVPARPEPVEKPH